MSDLVFTKINDAAGFRKAELESVKDIIHLLQGFEQLSKIRTNKAEKSLHLTKQMKELGALMNKLKAKLPTVHENAPAPVAPPKGRGKKAKIPLSKEEQRQLPQGLAALEHQLRDIEGKLNVLG